MMNRKLQLLILIFAALIIPSLVHAADKVTVKIAKVADVAIYPERSAPATVVSLNQSVISAQIAAKVDELSVLVGDLIEKGGPLAKLDCSDHELSYQESIASLEALQTKRDLAKRRLERTRQLTIKQSVAEEILDERESDYAVLSSELKGSQAEIKMKKLEQSRCIVTSPFRALVVERVSAVGEFVNVGTALVKVIDIENIEVSAQVSSRDSDQVSQASKLYFEHNNIRTLVKLRSIVQAINAETRNREVRLIFSDSQVLPGTAGKLIWSDERTHIPSELLVRRNGELGVFTVEGNVAKFNTIPTAQAGRASATSLTKDAHVVTEGHFSLKESVPVEIVN